MWNIKNPVKYESKDITNFIFFKVGRISRSMALGKKIMVYIKRSCYKEYTCERSKPYHLPTKIIADLNFLWKVGYISRSRSIGKK